jgi:hypothetical protein
MCLSFGGFSFFSTVLEFGWRVRCPGHGHCGHHVAPNLKIFLLLWCFEIDLAVRSRAPIPAPFGGRSGRMPLDGSFRAGTTAALWVDLGR